jgi:twitching motility protein PilT
MKVGRPPMVRTRNELRPSTASRSTSEEMVRLLLPMMNERMRKIFEETAGPTSPTRSMWTAPRGGSA